MNSYIDLINHLVPLYDRGEARAVVRLLLEKWLGMSWTDVLGGGLAALDDSRCAALHEKINVLSRGVPVQYVLGETEFCGRTFRVSPAVLIPRPETEELVERVSAIAKPGMRVLDIGTGSGCIALSLGLSHPGWHVEGIDISQEALLVAAQNKARLGAENVSFRLEDILHPDEENDRRWDVIVSNPPYICRSECEDMHRNVVANEPHTALFVPDGDPLLFYRAIANYGLGRLSKGGRLFFEINRRYGAEVASLLTTLGYDQVDIISDQFGNQRIVETSL